MVKIDENKCVGCQQCVTDCIMKNIIIENGVAKLVNEQCFECGHCFSICAHDAITIDGLPNDDIVEVTKSSFSANDYLNHIRNRRSVRLFNDKKVEEEKIDQLLEVARATPTAKNVQDVSYIVVKDNMEKLREMFLRATNNEDVTYDRVTRQAPVMIFVVSSFADSKEQGMINGALATASIDAMVPLLDLGGFYCLMGVYFANNSPEILKFLNLKEGQAIVNAYCLGYSDINYVKSAPRKAIDVTYL